MQAIIEVQAQAKLGHTPVGVSLLDVPVATLQIVQASDVVKDRWLDRALLEPTLAQNADGLWVLTVRRQGLHGQFDVPYVGSDIILADAELGLIVVLISYHGTSPEKYGRLGYLVQKGQYYRYFQQAPDGTWAQVHWRQLNDALRSLIISTVQEQGPAWARSPGKLRADYKPPTKPVTLTTFKVVRVHDGRYFSLFDPTQEYVLGQRLKEPAKRRHGGGFYSYPTEAMGTAYLADCVVSIPFHRDVATSHLALLEVEIGGRIINYGHKLASTYLRPLRVLEVREAGQ